MLVAINDQPLTAEQQQAETNHLAWLMNNPEQLRKKQAREKEDADRSLRILKALPDAFRYNMPAPRTASRDSAKRATVGASKVRAQSGYSPPSRVEQCFRECRDIC